MTTDHIFFAGQMAIRIPEFAIDRNALEAGLLTPEDLIQDWLDFSTAKIRTVAVLENIIDGFGCNVESRSDSIFFCYEMLAAMATHQNVNCVRSLLYKYNANVNAQDAEGKTALMFAFAGGKNNSFLSFPATIDLLLSHPSIDVHCLDHDGNSALSYALFWKAPPDMIERLVSMITKREVLEASIAQAPSLYVSKKTVRNLINALKRFNKRKRE